MTAAVPVHKLPSRIDSVSTPQWARDMCSADQLKKLGDVLRWRKLLAAAELTSTAKSCGQALANSFGGNGACYRSGEDVALDSGFKRNAAGRALSALESAGWLEVVVKGSSKAGATVYRARYPEARPALVRASIDSSRRVAEVPSEPAAGAEAAPVVLDSANQASQDSWPHNPNAEIRPMPRQALGDLPNDQFNQYELYKRRLGRAERQAFDHREAELTDREAGTVTQPGPTRTPVHPRSAQAPFLVPF